MVKVFGLVVEFFTNLQIIALVNHEAIKTVVEEVKTVIIVIAVRVIFLGIEKSWKKLKKKEVTK